MFRADQTTGKNKTRFMNKGFLLAVAMVICLSATVQANRDVAQIHSINIAKNSLDKTLKSLAKQTGVQLLFPFDLVNTLESKPLSGDYRVMDALDILLKDTGLSGSLTGSGVIAISRYELNGKGKKNMKNTMNTKKNVLATFVALFAAGGVSQGVLAQDESEAAVQQSNIDEIIVTANRREQNLQDVAMSVAVIDPADFTGVGLTQIEDIIAYTPGVTATGARAPGQPQITVRGVSGSESAGSTVGFYLDDIPLSSNSPYGNAGKFNFDGMLGDIERVEVLKGDRKSVV